MTRSINQTSLLPSELFGLTPERINMHCIYLCVKSELAAQRQGTHKTKTLAEVAGSGKKPWMQKGLGKARAGTRRSPIWVGGGRVFGPSPERNYKLKVTKKQKHLAFLSALSLLALEKRVAVFEVQNALNQERISTKTAVNFLKTNNFLPKKGHLLIASLSKELFLATKNVPNIKVVKPLSVTVSLLQAAAFFLCDQEAIKQLLELNQRRQNNGGKA